jgi:diguanylate cyclase (GGDEF)-like protein/PAS domain S-box-containing protein
MEKDDSFFERIAENMSDMVALHEPDGRYRWLSPSVKRILGYTSDELIGTNPYELFHPDDWEAIRTNTHEPAIDGDGNILIRYRIRCAKGEYVWFETLTQPILDNNGNVKELHTTSRNVTEQKRLEEILAENEALYRAGLDSLEEGVVVHDAEGRIITYNPSALDILGFSGDEMIGRVPRDKEWQAVYPDGSPFPPDELPVMVTLRTGKPCSQVLMGVYNPRWNAQRWISINSRPVRASGEQRAGQAAAVVSFEDVTERIDRENQLKLWSTVYQSSGEAIIIVDTYGFIQDVNEGFVDFLKTEKDVWVGQPVKEIVRNTRSEVVFDSVVWPTLETEDIWRGELWLRDDQGGVQTAWAAMTKVQQDVSSDVHYTLILSDFKEQTRQVEKLKYDAGHDSLTGLPNRLLLKDRFDVALGTAQRQQKTFACLYLDLNRFKPINDQYGHAVGDLLLQTVAEKISSVVRSIDTVSRIGGDEFIVLIFGLEKDNEYFALAERIARSVEEPVIVDGLKLTVSASIGVALYPQHGESQAELTAAGDEAMYIAKRNQLQVQPFIK